MARRRAGVYAISLVLLVVVVAIASGAWWFWSCLIVSVVGAFLITLRELSKARREPQPTSDR